MYSPGSYTPSVSASNVPASAHSSISWYQSRPQGASRDMSIPTTKPTCPSEISVNSRWNPGRSVVPAPERPRSSSMTTTRSAGQPNPTALSTSAYCSRVDSG